MTNTEFKNQIDKWVQLSNNAGLTMPNGSPVTKNVFHVVLGVGLSTFKKMMLGKKSMRPIQPYTEKHIRALTLLDESVFLDEVRLAISVYGAQ